MHPSSFIFLLFLLSFAVPGYIGKKSHHSTQQGFLNHTNNWSLGKTPPKPRTFTLVCCVESQTQAASPACTTSSTGRTLLIFQQHSRESSAWEFIGAAQQAQPCIPSNHKPQGHWSLCSTFISPWAVPALETGTKSDLVSSHRAVNTVPVLVLCSCAERQMAPEPALLQWISNWRLMWQKVWELCPITSLAAEQVKTGSWLFKNSDFVTGPEILCHLMQKHQYLFLNFLVHRAQKKI